MAKGASNSGKIVMSMGRFDGGMSTDYKNGIANSYYDAEALDARSIPSQMSVMPGLSTLSGSSNVTGLWVAIVQDQTGVKWAVDIDGAVYKVDTSNNITVVGQLPENSGAGIVYDQMTDYLFFTGQQSISSYGPITGYGGISSTTPTWQYDFLGKSADTGSGVIQLWNNATSSYSGNYRNNITSVGANSGITSSSQVGANPQAGATNSGVPAYTNVTIHTGISETPGLSTSFVPSIEPFYSISVYVVAKGTGNLTLTLHDGNDNVVQAVTIANGSVTANAYNEFVFSAPGVRSYLGGSATGNESLYHFHLTSSVSSDTFTFRSIGSTLIAYNTDGTTTNSSTPDLTGIDFILFAYRMVKTNNGLHPTTLFTGNNMFMAIGNGDYVSTWDMTMGANPTNSSYRRGALTLDVGYEVCGMTTNSGYLVIAAERRRTGGNSKEQDGMIYYWDGISQNWISRVQVPQGSPYSPQTFGNVTYFTVNGTLYAVSQPGVPDMKIRLISYQNGNYSGQPDSTVVYPNMMTVRNTELLIGYPSTSQNPDVIYGVYSWGAVEMTYPNSFLRTHMLNANQTYPRKWTSVNQLQIGCVYSFVDELWVSWQYYDSSGTKHAGVDFMNNSSSAAPNFSWASLIYDGGARYKQKRMLRYKINCTPLPKGCTLTGWYSINRGQPITVGSDGTSYTISTTGKTEVNIEPPHGRFHEIQWGFYGTTPSNTLEPPTITSQTFEIDPLNEEVNVAPDDQLDDYTTPTGSNYPPGAIVLPVGTIEDV